MPFLATTKQLYEWFSSPVSPSVRHTFLRSDVHANAQYQRSKFKVTDVKTTLPQFEKKRMLFWATTMQLYEWFSLFLRPSARPSVTFFTMFPSSYHHAISRSYYHCQEWCSCKSSMSVQGHRCQNNFAPIWAFPDYNSSLNSQMAIKWIGTEGKEYVRYCYSRQSVKFVGHTGKNANFDPNWEFPDCNSSLN